jgi:MGT family glycosyltransferase
MEAGDLFQRVIAGLSNLPINLIVTVGRDIDPAELGALPSNIHVHRFIPQAEILPHCQLVIAHGGSGSMLGALTHGVPMILIPMGADQPLNAARCTVLGVAQVLDAVAITSQTVRDAVEYMLDTPTYHEAAERIRNEIAMLPGAEQALALIERLAAGKRPITFSA